VTARVTNGGDLAGSYSVALMVNGTAESTQSIDVLGNSDGTTSFTTTRSAPGTYAVEVNGLSGQFTVAGPPWPAAFSVSSLSVSPNEVNPGGDATVSVAVSNTGDTAGIYAVILMVDGSIRESQQPLLAPHVSEEVE
jgi:uncharacterized membrane protein